MSQAELAQPCRNKILAGTPDSTTSVAPYLGEINLDTSDTLVPDTLSYFDFTTSSEPPRPVEASSPVVEIEPTYPDLPDEVWELLLRKCMSVARSCRNCSDNAVSPDDIAMSAMEGLVKSPKIRKIYADPAKDIHDLINVASRAVRNRTINHINARGIRPQQGELAETDRLYADPADQYEEFIVDRAISRLLRENPRYNAQTGTDFRETFYLRRICGLSGPDIAKRLGISEKTVATRLNRYERLLRQSAHDSGLYSEYASNE